MAVSTADLLVAMSDPSKGHCSVVPTEDWTVVMMGGPSAAKMVGSMVAKMVALLAVGWVGSMVASKVVGMGLRWIAL